MSQITVAVLIKQYDLDALEVGKDYVYVHCGRGLSAAEFETLGQEIKAIQETANE